MLVLSRKVGETIRIGADVFITLVKIQGNRASLSISAPLDIPIHRLEIAERVDLGEAPVGCSWCKAIRVGGMWTGPDDPSFPEARSHGICSVCQREQTEKFKAAKGAQP